MSLTHKTIWSGFLGNILETYDLIIYGFMASYIAHYFFNPNNHYNLFYAFMVLFIGYLARPLGALLFGFLSDYRGRKKAIAFSTLLVGATTTLIGLLPGYHTVGNTAFYCLLLLRLAQGLALGGEYTNSIIFLVEHGYQKRRGFMGSWATNGNCAGFLVAAIIGTATVYALSHHLIPEWGWRLPFLFASIGAVIIFQLQYTCPETLPFILTHSTEPPNYAKTYIALLIKTAREKKQACLLVIAIMWLSVSFTYLLFIYGPTYMTSYSHLPLHHALAINVIAFASLIVLTPCFGYWSDKIGRKPLLFAATISFLVLAYPYFVIVSHGHLLDILTIQTLMTLPAAAFYGIAPVLMVELMPIETRAVISGLVYNLTASIVGGSAPILALTLIHELNNPIAPAYYLMLSAVITLIALLRLKEPVITTNIDPLVTEEHY